MLASQSENADDKHPSEKVAKEDIPIERIECPRCHDVMRYICEECSFI